MFVCTCVCYILFDRCPWKTLFKNISHTGVLFDTFFGPYNKSRWARSYIGLCPHSLVAHPGNVISLEWLLKKSWKWHWKLLKNFVYNSTIQFTVFDCGIKFDFISTKRSGCIPLTSGGIRLPANRGIGCGNGERKLLVFFPWITPFGFSEILQLDDPEERDTAGGPWRRRRISAVRLGGRCGRSREMFLRIRRVRLDSHDRWVIAGLVAHDET